MIARPRPSRLLAPALLACAAVLAAPATGRAALILQLANLTAPAGSTGSFDVVLRSTDLSDSFRVASDTVQLSLVGASGVRFTGATIATASPYIYATSGTTFGAGAPLSYDPFPGTTFTASDSEFGPIGYRLIGAKAIFGLVHVTYSVDPGATFDPRSIVFGAAGTSLADDQGNAVPFTTAGAVPEPASAALVAIASIGIGVLARRRGGAGRA